MSPPEAYLRLNDRPRCNYNSVETILLCLESYKGLADINDRDKLHIRQWVKDNSQ